MTVPNRSLPADVVDERRPSSFSVVAGVFLLSLFPLALIVTYVFVDTATRYSSSATANKGGAMQFAVASAWLAAAGTSFVRRGARTSHRLPAVLALSAGVLGLLTFLPFSLGQQGQAAIDRTLIPKAFAALGLAMIFAGLGHWQRSDRGRGMSALFMLSALAAVAGVVFFVTR